VITATRPSDEAWGAPWIKCHFSESRLDRLHRGWDAVVQWPVDVHRSTALMDVLNQIALACAPGSACSQQTMTIQTARPSAPAKISRPQRLLRFWADETLDQFGTSSSGPTYSEQWSGRESA